MYKIVSFYRKKITISVLFLLLNCSFRNKIYGSAYVYSLFRAN